MREEKEDVEGERKKQVITAHAEPKEDWKPLCFGGYQGVGDNGCWDCPCSKECSVSFPTKEFVPFLKRIDEMLNDDEINRGWKGGIKWSKQIFLLCLKAYNKEMKMFA